ncbi:NAD(P)/FAD-dependent oxidoreductase [Ancylobacter lacus]|uniref:NAD(P)/FAD-dependent oxidoreductase n=1 Tax=Ancylobacter lacus TaxID=2579970 RepID=UPI001BD19D46|nr:FAD-dependent oxidoreductase [Ancylobacter lacus]MBS7538015.1 FAD-dependent oxidoreductase [Ancylobacter lacus]
MERAAAAHIAIVGAGMAGLAAARRLQAAGFAVTLVDKGRDVGGRMATRRATGFAFDHGAQFFTARSESFRAVVAQWRAAGQADIWDASTGGAGALAEGAAEPMLVGTPGMTAPCRAMAAGLPVALACTVTGLHRDGVGYTLSTATGPVDTPGNGRFDAVLLAVPAPQAAALVAPLRPGWAGRLASIRYAPCWALMAGFEGRRALPPSRRPMDDMLRWIAHDSGKPGRAEDGTAVVAHAMPDWSRANLERPAEEIAPLMLARLREVSGITASPVHLAAHRWRYALVEQPLGEACLWDPATRLGLCGDGCLAPRVEAAFASGEALAARLIADLTPTPSGKAP